jgi:hypothetical protein
MSLSSVRTRIAGSMVGTVKEYAANGIAASEMYAQTDDEE